MQQRIRGRAIGGGAGTAALPVRAGMMLSLAAAALVTATGCHPFEAVWSAKDLPADEGMLGRWTGTWVSGHNAHTGGLRAVITPSVEAPADPARRFVRYHATYAGILQFGMDIEMTTRPDGRGGWTFEGEHDLGTWGKFRYNGRCDGGRFEADYKSPFDHGRFEMGRLPKPDAPTGRPATVIHFGTDSQSGLAGVLRSANPPHPARFASHPLPPSAGEGAMPASRRADTWSAQAPAAHTAATDAPVAKDAPSGKAAPAEPRPPADTGTVAIGKPAAAFRLPDLKTADGKPFDSAELAGKVTVLCFQSTVCGVVDRHQALLAKLAADHADKGVVVLAVFSNHDEKDADIREYAVAKRLGFPCLRDADAGLAVRYGITHTPTFVLVDAKGNLRFNGPWKDNSSGTDLLPPALEAVLAGREPAATGGKAFGCKLSRKK